MSEASTGDESPGLSVLTPLLGSWKGTSTGRFGTGEVERVAESVLGDRFVRVTTTSVAPDDMHEDIAIFSYDEERNVLVLREFHVEGYVNHYVLVAAEGESLTFESEHIENPFDPTLRARTTIHLSDPVLETLELATEGRPFEVCVEISLERAPADF